MGAVALIWSLCLRRNDKVFNDISSSLMQVIFRCTETLCSWPSLQRLKNRDLFIEVCTVEKSGEGYFFQHGWRHNLRVGPSSP